MNEQIIYRGKLTFFVHYKDCDGYFEIAQIQGSTDTSSLDAFFDLPTPTDDAKSEMLEMLGLNCDYWRFVA